MDLKRGLREPGDVASITESHQLGGGRVDFALVVGAVGLGIVMTQHAPAPLFLLFCAASLGWSFSDRAQRAVKSWVRDWANDWSQPASTEPTGARAANAVFDLLRHGPIGLGAGQSGPVSKLNERTRARPEKSAAHLRKMHAVKAERGAIEVALRDVAVEERNALIRKTQIAITVERDAIEAVLGDFAVLERNQGNRLH